MPDFKPPCGCTCVTSHRPTCRLVLSRAIADLPEKLPSGVTVESLHLDGVGRVYLSNYGGILCMTPDEGRALARTLFLGAEEAASEEVLVDAA